MPPQRKQPQKAPEEPANAPSGQDREPQWYCMECGDFVREGDSSHDNHPLEKARKHRATKGAKPRSVALETVSGSAQPPRISTFVKGFDRVLGGGGLVTNAIVMIDGEPGIGKTTLLSMTGGRIAASGKNVLYASGEETSDQIAVCARRIGHVAEGVRVLHTSSIEDILAEVDTLEAEEWHVDVLIADSAQALSTSTASSPLGSAHMVGAVANVLREFAKRRGVAIILVCQWTKTGDAAGPKSMEHAVDARVSFGRDGSDIRWLRTVKNRFGPTGEIVQFEMGPHGLKEVEDPSLVAWQDLVGDPGVVGCVCAHLAKPLVIPVEALVTPEAEGRTIQSEGYPQDRVKFMLESLSRHAGISFAGHSVRVRVPMIAGAEIDDSALDLAVAAACWSSLNAVNLGKSIFVGSVGLSGKLQSPSRIEARIQCAERASSGMVIVGHPKSKRFSARVPTLSVQHVSELADVLQSMKEKKT